MLAFFRNGMRILPNNKFYDSCEVNISTAIEIGKYYIKSVMLDGFHYITVYSDIKLEDFETLPEEVKTYIGVLKIK